MPTDHPPRLDLAAIPDPAIRAAVAAELAAGRFVPVVYEGRVVGHLAPVFVPAVLTA